MADPSQLQQAIVSILGEEAIRDISGGQVTYCDDNAVELQVAPGRLIRITGLPSSRDFTIALKFPSTGRETKHRSKGPKEQHVRLGELRRKALALALQGKTREDHQSQKRHAQRFGDSDED